VNEDFQRSDETRFPEQALTNKYVAKETLEDKEEKMRE
jgi:hypothetical protein